MINGRTGLPANPLLIVHAGALGDLVCVFPVIQALGRRFRTMAILCQNRLGRLAVAEGLVGTWFPLEAAWTASLFTGNPGPEARRRLAAFSHVLAFSRSEPLLGALLRLGVRLCGVPPRPPENARQHVTTHALEQVRQCGFLGGGGGGDPGLSGGIRAAMRSKTVLLHPGAGSRRKRWPLAGFIETAGRLQAMGFTPEYLIGPAEDDLAVQLKNQARPVRRLSDPSELAALLRSAGGYIGNDSGASHLAGWVGLPSVVIFGPSDPERWRPNGPAVEVVRPALDCVPCFEAERENCAQPDCLNRIAPADVIEAFCLAAGHETRPQSL
jgi:heptosyltransferase III